MEPLDDRELNQILREWNPAATPASLDRIPERRTSWWRWLLGGTIKVPVPVGAAVLVIVALLLIFRAPGPRQPKQSDSRQVRVVSLADFQPVNQLEPRIIGRANEGN